MPFVEIYKLQNDGSQQVIAVCRLVGDAVKCEGNEIFIKNLEREGILDYSQPQLQKIFFKDGLRFLEQLKNNFKSGYLSASEIKED